jgi:sugar phosphate isomerase/epimerase
VRLPRSRSSHPFHCIALSESSSMMQTHRLAGTLFEDTVHRRRYGGDGVFDLTGMIKALHTAGRAGPWGVEIPSVEHRFLPVDEVLSRAAISARRALERAR